MELDKTSLIPHQVRQQEQALEAAKAKLQNFQTALNPSNAQVAIASIDRKLVIPMFAILPFA